MVSSMMKELHFKRIFFIMYANEVHPTWPLFIEMPTVYHFIVFMKSMSSDI